MVIASHPEENTKFWKKLIITILSIFFFHIFVPISLSYALSILDIETPSDYLQFPTSQWIIDNRLVDLYQGESYVLMVFDRKVLKLEGDLKVTLNRIIPSSPKERVLRSQLRGDNLYLLLSSGKLLVYSLKEDKFKELLIHPGAHSFNLKDKWLVIREKRAVNLYKLAPNPTLLWRGDIGRSLFGTPGVDTSGTVYVKDRYSNIFAFRDPQRIAKFKLGRPTSDPLPYKGDVLVCTPKGLFRLGVSPQSDMPFVKSFWEAPVNLQGNLKVKVAEDRIWCSGDNSAAAWDLQGRVLARIKPHYYRPTISLFPAYLLRDEILRRWSRYRTKRWFYHLRVSYPSIIKVSSKHDLVIKGSGGTHVQLDVWKMYLTFRRTTDNRTVFEIKEGDGFLFIRDLQEGGLMRTRSDLFYTYTETTYYGNLAYSILSSLLTNDLYNEERKFWKSVSYSKDNLRAFQLNGTLYIAIIDFGSTRIFRISPRSF